MQKRLSILIALAGLLLVGTLGVLFSNNLDPTPVDQRTEVPSIQPPVPEVPPSAPPEPTPPTPTPLPAQEEATLVEPINEFKARITKKNFGTYVTPQNSPVIPEKFTGYHTAVDVEFDDVPGDVDVRAITDGKVTTSRTATGYGGVMVIEHTIDGNTVPTIYGHLDPASMVANGASVKRGDRIGILGDGYTSETDGERKHLHFGMRKGTVSLLGYAQSESQLSGWYNPLDFY